MTYFGTYLTANFIDTASSVRKGTDIKTVTTGTEKFVATSALVFLIHHFSTLADTLCAEQTCLLVSSKTATLRASLVRVLHALYPSLPSSSSRREMQ